MPGKLSSKNRLTIAKYAQKELAKRREKNGAPVLTFPDFVKQAWHLVEPRKLIWEPHMDVVCAHLVAISEYKCKRLVLNVPPGTSKSLLTSVFFPAWVWTFDAGRKFIFSSYADTVSLRDGNRFQQLVESDWYTAQWGAMEGKQWSAKFMTSRVGGVRFATTVEGQVTGQHADHQFVDDPIKPTDATGASAQSGTALRKCLEWWTGTMTTRSTDIDKTTRVIVMQRIADGDLAGEMLDTGEYHHLCLPMEYVPERHSKTPWGEDWRTEKDQPLAPIRFPASAFPRLKKELGSPMVVAAQWQQDPVPEGGNIFHKDWFHNTYESVPHDAIWLASIDATFKKNAKSDFVCIQVWAHRRGFFYLVDMVLERMAFTDTVQAILDIRTRYPKISTLLIEDTANGPAIIDQLQNGKYRVPGIIPIRPMGDKVARAHAVTSYFKAGDVLMPDENSPEWLHWGATYVRQMTRFPKALHDDAVDASSQALSHMTGTLSEGDDLVQAMRALKTQAAHLEPKASEPTEFKKKYGSLRERIRKRVS